MLAPAFGAFFYLFIHLQVGTKVIARRLQKNYFDTSAFLEQDELVKKELEIENPRVAGLAHYVKNYGGYPIYNGTGAKYYPFGQDVFEDLKKRLQLPFSVVYNQSGVDIGSIGQMHAVLCKFALKETHFGAQNLICFKNDDTDELQLAEDGEELLYLRRAMQKGDIAQIKDILSRFLEKCKQENCKTEILYQYLESIRM